MLPLWEQAVSLPKAQGSRVESQGLIRRSTRRLDSSSITYNRILKSKTIALIKWWSMKVKINRQSYQLLVGRTINNRRVSTLACRNPLWLWTSKSASNLKDKQIAWILRVKIISHPIWLPIQTKIISSKCKISLDSKNNSEQEKICFKFYSWLEK